MPITIDQIRKILEEQPINRHKIPVASRHEDRIKFHTALRFENSFASVYNDWLAFARKQLPKEKFKVFLRLLRYPLETSSILGEIFTALEKVFDGQNKIFKYEFVTDESLEDWQNYSNEVLKIPEFWRTKGFQALKTAFNSIVIVDLPEEQEGDRPAPYFYLLPITEVVDLSIENGDIKFIFFKQPGDRLAVFDDESFRIFNYKDGKITGEPLINNPHNLGYCPAKFFWQKAINEHDPVVKQSVVSEWITKFDRLQFDIISKESLDLTSAWPITWGFKVPCDFENDKTGWYCDDGFLRSAKLNDAYLFDNGGNLHECPRCSSKRFNGPGTYMEVDPPGDDNDKANLRDPVGIVGPDIDALKYHDEKIKEVAKLLFSGITGSSFEDVLNKQSINKDQVMSLFESRKNVLLQIAHQFEVIQAWTDSTVCRLRYPDFIGATVSYGTDFYLYDHNTLMQSYQDAVKEGADTLTLDFLQEVYLNSRDRNNPDQLLKSKIVFNLDPYRHLTLEQVAKLFEGGIILYEPFYIKTNFSTLIARFERENGSLIQFGENLDFKTKVDRIFAGLLTYVPEQKEGDGSKQSLKEALEAYGIAFRAGAVTAQTEDEVKFRELLGLGEMSAEVKEAWEKGNGIRRPITLKDQSEIDATIN